MKSKHVFSEEDVEKVAVWLIDFCGSEDNCLIGDMMETEQDENLIRREGNRIARSLLSSLNLESTEQAEQRGREEWLTDTDIKDYLNSFHAGQPETSLYKKLKSELERRGRK